MHRQQLETQILTSLHGRIPDEFLPAVRDAVSIALADYDISARETNLIPYDGIPPYLEAYIVAKKIEGTKDSTLKLYMSILRGFFKSMMKPADAITTNDIRKYLFYDQRTANNSGRTMDTKRTVIKSFFSWCVAEEYLSKNPCAGIKPIRYVKTPRETLSSTELELVRMACSSVRDRAMIEFFYSTGCRVSEFRILKKSDIDYINSEVTLFGKGAKYRKSYITQKAMMYLRMYLDSRDDADPHLFVSERAPHGGLSKAGVERIFGRIGESAGIGRKLHPHLIRHTMATDCLSRGMSVAEIQRILGHADISTTMEYAKVMDDDVKAKHEKCIA